MKRKVKMRSGDIWEIPKGKTFSQIGYKEQKRITKEYENTDYPIRKIQRRHRLKWPHIVSAVVKAMGGRLRKPFHGRVK